MAAGTTTSIGMALLTLGFGGAFVGFAGWQDPEQFAVVNSWLLLEADSDTQRAYGRLVAVCIGGAGLAGVLVGRYLILSPVLP